MQAFPALQRGLSAGLAANRPDSRQHLAAGTWVADLDGGPRCYRAADGLQYESWRDLSSSAVIEVVAAGGLKFDRETGTGVILHMLGGLRVDGRMGLTAIGGDAGAADALCAAMDTVVHSLAAVTTSPRAVAPRRVQSVPI